MARFVITYRGLHNPSIDEERELLSALDAATVVDRMPGVLLVESSEAVVGAALLRNTGWTFAPEVRLSPQPRRRF
jgi:hypothetical protein